MTPAAKTVWNVIAALMMIAGCIAMGYGIVAGVLILGFPWTLILFGALVVWIAGAIGNYVNEQP